MAANSVLNNQRCEVLKPKFQKLTKNKSGLNFEKIYVYMKTKPS